MSKSRLAISLVVENLVFVWGVSTVALIVSVFVEPIFTSGVIGEIREVVSAETLSMMLHGGWSKIINILMVYTGIGALDRPTEGKILYNGYDVSELDADRYRANNVSIIFQSYNLLFNYNAINNIGMILNVY